MTVLIVAPGAGGYAGMDRPPLGSQPDVPEPLVLRGLELESSGDEAGLRAFLADLRASGVTQYDVIGLADPVGDGWEFLGYDVGETTAAAWSAIKHRAEVLDGEPRLNEHGLFSQRSDAEAFLQAYLQADDPDRGWTATGWTDNPSIYAVIPISRLRQGLTIHYGTGNENAPGDPFGRTDLTIGPDGSARLDHRHIGQHRAWTGVIDDAVLQRLHAALERSAFPQVDQHPIPPGSALRTLVVESPESGRSGVHVAWHAAKDLAGYDELFEILDSLVRQMSEDSVTATPDTLGPVVSDLRRVG